MHGAPSRVTVQHEKKQGEYALFPLYHPASIIYNRSLQEVYQADLEALKAWLARQANA
jgi:DNA polymerase